MHLRVRLDVLMTEKYLYCIVLLKRIPILIKNEKRDGPEPGTLSTPPHTTHRMCPRLFPLSPLSLSVPFHSNIEEVIEVKLIYTKLEV